MIGDNGCTRILAHFWLEHILTELEIHHRKAHCLFTSACPEGTSHCCRLLATKRFINASLHSRPTAAVGFQSKNISNVSKDRLTSFPWDKAGESSCNGLGPGWWYFASVQCGWGKRMNNCRVQMSTVHWSRHFGMCSSFGHLS